MERRVEVDGNIRKRLRNGEAGMLENAPTNQIAYGKLVAVVDGVPIYISKRRPLIAIAMEVEVKLRLRSSADHHRLCTLLSPHHRRTMLQQNLFFDGPNSELSSNLAALRLRFHDLDTRCVLSLKSKPQISAGISRIEEQEEDIDPVLGRQCAAEPWRLTRIESSDIIRRVKEEFNVVSDSLISLGGFRNVRGVYEWNGLNLEVDETHYSFGSCYEIECETSEPETAKKLLEEMLQKNGIEYTYSSASKFALFRAGKMLD